MKFLECYFFGLIFLVYIFTIVIDYEKDLIISITFNRNFRLQEK